MDDVPVVVNLLPSALKALTKRKLVFGVNSDVNPLVDAGIVSSNGCPD